MSYIEREEKGGGVSFKGRVKKEEGASASAASGWNLVLF